MSFLYEDDTKNKLGRPSVNCENCGQSSGLHYTKDGGETFTECPKKSETQPVGLAKFKVSDNVILKDSATEEKYEKEGAPGWLDSFEELIEDKTVCKIIEFDINGWPLIEFDGDTGWVLPEDLELYKSEPAKVVKRTDYIFQTGDKVKIKPDHTYLKTLPDHDWVDKIKEWARTETILTVKHSGNYDISVSDGKFRDVYTTKDNLVLVESVDKKSNTQENKPMAETPKSGMIISDADVKRYGDQLTIPEGMSIDMAIALLERRKTEENQVISIQETINVFPTDGAQAFAKAMERMFGYVLQEPTPGFFGPTPPKLLSVEIGFGQTVMVPWGSFSLPGIEGTLKTTINRVKDQFVFSFSAEVKRKSKEKIHQLAELTRKIAQEESIYKGKAVTMRFFNQYGDKIDWPEPSFLDLSKVDESKLVFSKDVEGSIQTNLFTPIEKSAMCRENKIPLKRGILLSGKYGTGKTLVTYVTASRAVKNGWTFLYCQRANELPEMIQFAQKYQPAVIFCEDIDREASGRRTVKMDDLLNTIDGIDSKNTEIMVVLTTNHLENINVAMLRPGRLDAIINVLPPDAEAVEKLIRLYAGKLLPGTVNLTEIGKKLAGNIPAVIREVVERSKLSALRLGHKFLTEAALEDATFAMKQQIELLSKVATEESLKKRVSNVLGQAVMDGLGVNGELDGEGLELESDVD